MQSRCRRDSALWQLWHSDAFMLGAVWLDGMEHVQRPRSLRSGADQYAVVWKLWVEGENVYQSMPVGFIRKLWRPGGVLAGRHPRSAVR